MWTRDAPRNPHFKDRDIWGLCRADGNHTLMDHLITTGANDPEMYIYKGKEGRGIERKQTTTRILKWGNLKYFRNSQDAEKFQDLRTCDLFGQWLLDIEMWLD